jgi:hypothetical protein
MRCRLSLVCAIVVLGIFVDASVYAQQVDLGATWTRYFKFFEAGNDPAALAEAQYHEGEVIISHRPCGSWLVATVVDASLSRSCFASWFFFFASGCVCCASALA